MTKSLHLSTLAVPVGSLDSYIWQVNQIPMLTKEEEYAYAEAFQESNDLESARQLVLAHLRYVVRVAKGYMGYGLALGDLIQEGNVGLMKAVKRFDPKMGVRLVSFAVHWIKAEIHEFVIRNWRIVKIATTKAQRKLFFKLRQQKDRLGWFSDEEVKAVANDLGVSKEEVLCMEQRLNANDMAFDSPNVDESDDSSPFMPVDYLACQDADPLYLIEAERGETQGREQLHLALEALDERSQDILKRRWLDDEAKMTLTDLAVHYGISAERVRQLEQQALKKLRKTLQG
ncbi:MAG: RNA polymerase factor sigma-32 [Legionellales bacterium RIFCSPHIGHO2_12_FULL_37_14]|nr:MAG: RNA polymerase factor sigma-32 [Legionellales bacterium RIFCSPHIGHO2_12_FULL_37_14]